MAAENLIKHKMCTIIFWAKVGVLASQSISLISTVVLARLLSPAEFGLIGMIAVFMMIGNVFANCGLGAALVRKNRITLEDASTVFWFNLLLSVGIYILLFGVSGRIAEFFGYPILKPLIRVMALAIIFNASGIVQGAYAQIQLKFKETTIFHAIAGICATTTAIWLAWHRFGVWSLIAHTLVASFITNLLLILFIRFRPYWRFSRKSFRELISFGSSLLLVNFLDQTASNIHGAIIGKYYPVPNFWLLQKNPPLQLDNIFL